GVTEQAAVPRAGSLDIDRVTDLQRVGPPAQTQERVGIARLESPVLNLARLFVLDIDVEETVGVCPLDLRHRPSELDRLCRGRPLRDRVMWDHSHYRHK